MRTELQTRICGQEATTAGATIAALPPPGAIASLLDGAKLERELQSSITTDWRVAWTPQECARDLFQNFRDANADALDRIKITTAESMAIISAPAPMDLEHAFFLGSTKAKEAGDIGQFGEGLKVPSSASCVIMVPISPWPAATARCGSSWARSIPRAATPSPGVSLLPACPVAAGGRDAAHHLRTCP